MTRAAAGNKEDSSDDRKESKTDQKLRNHPLRHARRLNAWNG